MKHNLEFSGGLGGSSIIGVLVRDFLISVGGFILGKDEILVLGEISLDFLSGYFF